MTAPSAPMLKQTILDRDVLRSIWLSVYTAGSAALICFALGTPLAYLLARSRFRGKHVVESVIDLPIVIPHPVVGIAILGIAGKGHPIGQLLHALGVRLMGTVAGIITVLVFVGLPFFVNSAKDGFESVPPRLEKVSRSLGASMGSTFFKITFPLAWRSILIGFIMACARAVSEFGAVVIVAYHPMIAPVMIYERYEAYGLKYSQPVAFWLVFFSLLLFVVIRTLSLKNKRPA
ncbi:MAG: ABC transporter permease, partial [Spirochaetales bacterium]|nr:ABC transporter permease [Spirochaetales bacterium]